MIARHKGERSVAALEQTAQKAKDFLALRAKADAGDRDSRIAVEFLRLDMDADSAKLDDAKKRIADLGELTAEQKKRADALLADVEAFEIVSTISAGRPAAAKKAYDMRKAGRAPSSAVSVSFWYLVLEGAEAAADAALYEDGLAVLKARTFERQDATLKKLKEKK